MNIAEALKELDLGNKITHRFFTDEEYLVKIEGSILTEEGYIVTREFWELRTGEEWQIDWELYEMKK